MFKYIQRLLDADEGDTASGGSTPGSATTTETEVSSDSSSENNQQQPATGIEAMRAIAANIVKKSDSQADAVEEKEESDVPKEDTTDEEAEEKDEETDETEESKKDDSETEETESEEVDHSASDKERKPVPYERFEKATRDKQELESKIEEWTPLVQSQEQLNQILNTAGVSLAEFQNMVEVLTLSKTDPAAALVRLKPLYKEVSEFDEDSVSPEIQAKIDALPGRVKEGDMSQEAADELKESWLAQSKAAKQSKLGAKKDGFTQAQREKAYVDSFVNAANSWGTAKRKSDPDYKPKAKADAPDGLYEVTEAFFTRAMSQNVNNIKSPKNLTDLLDQSFTAAKRLLTPQKQSATKKIPSSTTATKKNESKPKNVFELVQRIAAKHNVNYVPSNS
jgi:hypothetical protein